MMDKHLEQVLYCLETMAALAYWKDRIHCGDDFDANCECKHYDMCLAEDTLKAELRKLKTR